MGREVKRVPLDFDWPVDKIWYGYLINFCNGDCADCRKFAKLKNMKMTDYNCPVFEDKEPPSGAGWQMWETCSEGSPISPVFETPELLAHWLADNNASSFGYMTATYDQWLKMIMLGWAPSAVRTSEGLKSGVESIGDSREE